MGLWRGDLEGVVNGLAKEAVEGLKDGYLVGMECVSDPYKVYVATAATDERFVVVGVMYDLPEFMGGQSPARDASTGRLRSITVGRNNGALRNVREGIVDDYLPFVVEEF